jgi:hypothetical protein
MNIPMAILGALICGSISFGIDGPIGGIIGIVIGATVFGYKTESITPVLKFGMRFILAAFLLTLAVSVYFNLKEIFVPTKFLLDVTVICLIGFVVGIFAGTHAFHEHPDSTDISGKTPYPLPVIILVSFITCGLAFIWFVMGENNKAGPTWWGLFVIYNAMDILIISLSRWKGQS